MRSVRPRKSLPLDRADGLGREVVRHAADARHLGEDAVGDLLEQRPVELVVYEGISHAQYYFNPEAPETTQHFINLKNFFERYLK